MCAAGMALALLLAGPSPARAFMHVGVGEKVPNPELRRLGGGRERLLSKARVTVFVFFRPNQDHSLQTLGQLAALETELAGRDLRFVAVTSDAYDAEEVAATAREAGLKMPVLIDAGDALYGALGVALHPVVGLAAPDARLLAYQHFLKVNMLDVLRARIQLALGEIDAEELARTLDPPAAGTGSPAATARRRATLSRMLLERGHPGKAAESARAAIEIAPQVAEGHTALAAALAAQGRCRESREAQEAARRLDASAPQAPPCKGK
jgi:peroxiredoxin